MQAEHEISFEFPSEIYLAISVLLFSEDDMILDAAVLSQYTCVDDTQTKDRQTCNVTAPVG